MSHTSDELAKGVQVNIVNMQVLANDCRLDLRFFGNRNWVLAIDGCLGIPALGEGTSSFATYKNIYNTIYSTTRQVVSSYSCENHSLSLEALASLGGTEPGFQYLKVPNKRFPISQYENRPDYS